jgi:hypothetical protein
MANLRAQAERFKQKQEASFTKAAHEQRRLGIVKRHRENTVGVLRNLLQSFPCPVSQPEEAGEEATLALLELASGFSSHKKPGEAVKVYEAEVAKARSRKTSARDTQESQLLADIVGAVCTNPELVEVTDAGDGQKVPTLPDMPAPWAGVMALALSDEKVPAERLFEGLEDGDKQFLRSGLESAGTLVKEKLQEAYINMVRHAEGLLKRNKAERAEEASEASPVSEASADLEEAAKQLAADLDDAMIILECMLAEDIPPDTQSGIKAAAERIHKIVQKLDEQVKEAEPQAE